MSDWHHAQYTHNRDFANELDADAFCDWVITGCFYAALHLVDRAFVEEFGHSPSRHTDRTAWTYNCAQTKDIAETYQNLRLLSEHARYEALHHDISPEQVTEATELLAEIEDHLAPE